MLYSWILLYIHSVNICNTLHLLIPNSRSISPLPPLPIDNHKFVLCVLYSHYFISIWLFYFFFFGMYHWFSCTVIICTLSPYFIFFPWWFLNEYTSSDHCREYLKLLKEPLLILNIFSSSIFVCLKWLTISLISLAYFPVHIISDRLNHFYLLKKYIHLINFLLFSY